MGRAVQSPQRDRVSATAIAESVRRPVDLSARVVYYPVRHHSPACAWQDEHHLSHSRFLRFACQRAGARDPDDLWDHLFEVGHRGLDTAAFVGSVLAYCAIARADATADVLEADGTLPRERAMAAAVAEEK